MTGMPPVPHLIATMERVEAAAYADLLHAAPSAWGCAAAHDVNGWWLFAPRLDLLLFNRVIGLGIERPPSFAPLRAGLERYRASGLRNFGVQLSPLAETPAVIAALEREGLAP